MLIGHVSVANDSLLLLFIDVCNSLFSDMAMCDIVILLYKQRIGQNCLIYFS